MSDAGESRRKHDEWARDCVRKADQEQLKRNVQYVLEALQTELKYDVLGPFTQGKFLETLGQKLAQASRVFETGHMARGAPFVTIRDDTLKPE